MPRILADIGPTFMGLPEDPFAFVCPLVFVAVLGLVVLVVRERR